MSYEMMIGLQVKDDKIYLLYREAMRPILLDCGGGFRYDFKVSEVLQNQEGRPINRVFAIYFKDKSNKDKFFSIPDYQKIKQKYFENSVEATTVISEYDRSL